MKWLNNLKIRTKLFTAFLLMGVIAGVIACLAIINVTALRDTSERLYKDHTKPMADVLTVAGHWQRSRVVIRDYILANEAEGMQSELDSLNAKFANVEAAYKNLDAAVEEPSIRSMLTDFKAKLDAYMPYKDQVLALARENKDAEAEAMLQSKEVDDAAGAVTDSIDALTEEFMAVGKSEQDESSLSAGSTVTTVIIISVAGVFLALLFGIVVSASIVKPIRKLNAGAGQLAKGDLSVDVTLNRKDELGELAKAYGVMVQSIQRLVADAGILADAAVAGHFDTRADASKHEGDYRKVMDGVNRTLDTIVDKVVWFEALLDAVPLPLSVTDMDMNWTFINKPVEQMLGVKRKDMLGMQCSNWNANICNTEKCGIARLRGGNLQTFFEQQGMNFQVDTSYILGAKGERIGHIEVVQDVTARSRANEFLKAEVGKISTAMKELADGNLSFEYSVGAGDQYTQMERESLLAIHDSLGSAVITLRSYVSQISGVLGEMADGNLSTNDLETFKGDFAGISESLNVILDSFNGVFSEMNAAAGQVSSGTQQVSAGAQALSQGATEQASAIEQLTASLAEIAEQTKGNAVNAGRASDLAIAAREEAENGNAKMRDLQQAMKEINDASANISKIIKVIDDIAFQTNLLALNAAVEAARAGQHGKGFAVVAEEVRNLAQRSAGAAKETTAMIEESIKKVKAGTKIANETADALGRIVTGVDKATELVGGIAKASGDQATAVAQVNGGVKQVSEVTQTNSATAEESAAASEELSSQAELLKEMVNKFALKDQAVPAGGPKRPTPKARALAPGKPAATKPVIALNDREFGKY